MSRLHEALKRAEADRLARDGGDGASILSADDAGLLPDLAAPLPSEAAAALPGPAVSAVIPIQSAGGNGFLDCPQKQWRPDLKHMLFFEKAHRERRGTEQFRTLRSRLYQIRDKRPLKSILVSSALPGEGKSFIAANLAQVLARQHGRRVLLLDADLRRSSLHSALGTTSAPGLTDYLAGEVDALAAIQRGPMESLYFMPSGRSASNPAELISSARMKTLSEQMAEMFDWIVVDSPPAVLVSDASMAARYCDGVLLVVQAASTPYDVASKLRHEFRQSPLLGVVLNQVEATATYGGYYYEYGRRDEKHPAEQKSKA